MTADSPSPTPTSDDREPSLRNATFSDVTARRLPRAESITAVIRHHVRPEAATTAARRRMHHNRRLRQ